MQREHVDLLVACRVSDVNAEQEAVELGFREPVDALLLDRVLSRQHHERFGERQRLPFDRHLPLLHPFEQGRLRASRCAIQFIGQQKLTKDRSLPQNEVARLTVEDLCPGDIRRQQVWGELDPLVMNAEDHRERPAQRRLRRTGDSFQQHVPTGEQRHEHLIGHVAHPDHNLLNSPLSPFTKITDTLSKLIEWRRCHEAGYSMRNVMLKSAELMLR